MLEVFFSVPFEENMTKSIIFFNSGFRWIRSELSDALYTTDKQRTDDEILNNEKFL